MIFTMSVNDRVVMQRLKNFPSNVRKNLLVAVTRLSLLVQRSVKEDKLSGQVLHVRTGTLRRSINREVTNDSAGVYATVGTNVAYGHIHEYGFTGTVNVRAHTRRSRAQMQMKKSGVKPVGEVLVRAHTMDMVMPKRSFLRSTLSDFRPRIQKDLSEAVLVALKEGE